MKILGLKKSVFGLAICLTISSCLQGPEAKRGSVVDNELRVGIIYAANGQPAVGARVRVFPVGHVPDNSLVGFSSPANDSSFTTRTDISGKYVVGSLPNGEYNVLADMAGQYSIQDSVSLTENTGSIPSDTLGQPGSMAGIVSLQPNHDPRSVTVQVLGTNSYANVDEKGAFLLQDLASGKYTLRILTSLSEYVPLFKSISVRIGERDTIKDTLKLTYLGIPVVTGLQAVYDTLNSIVTLSWDSLSYRDFAEYQVYRDFSPALDLSKLPVGIASGTVFRDSLMNPSNASLSSSLALANQQLEYRIRVRNKSDLVGLSYGNLKVEAATPSLVKTEIKLVAGLAKWDSARQVDSITVTATINNPTRRLVRIVWSLGSLQDSVHQDSLGGVLTAESSFRFTWPKEGAFQVFVTVLDDAGTRWSNKLTIPGNSAPTLNGNPALEINGYQDYKFSPVYTDLDQDTLRFAIVNLPHWARFDTLTGAISGTPVNSDTGVYSGIGVSVTDGRRVAKLPLFNVTVKGNPWIPKKTVPTSSALQGYAVTVADKIYLLTAFDSVRVYDPVNDSWTSDLPLPNLKPVRFAFATEWNGKILAFCYEFISPGENQIRTFLFDPANNAWETKTTYPGNNFSAGGAVVDGVFYTMGGGGFYAYDILADQWTSKTPMPNNLGRGLGGTTSSGWMDLKCVALNGKIYAMPGNETKTSGILCIYDVKTDTWVDAPATNPHLYSAVSAIGDRIYVAGGYDFNGVTAGVDAYDTESKTWNAKRPIPIPVQGMAFTEWNGKLFIFKGIAADGKYRDGVLEYDPTLDE